MTVQRLFESYLFENGYDVDDYEDGNLFNQFLLINNSIRREYGERTKTTRCSIMIYNNTQFYAIYSIYPFHKLILKMSIR